jgi:hypothetical protein
VTEGPLRRAADALYQEARRSSALAQEAPVGRRLAELGPRPTRAALLVWCSELRLALPSECPLEPRALAWALACEIEGDVRVAVLVLGCALIEQERLGLHAAEEAEIELRDRPSRAALRAVLQRWIVRGAAWGGDPIVEWMRGLCDRLKDGGIQ